MDLGSLTGMLVGVSMMMAMKTNTPELALAMEEGQAITTAAQNVMRHYSVEATQKTVDWIAFAGVLGGVVITRGVAINARLAQEKAEKSAHGGQVLRFGARRKRPDHLAPVEPGGEGEGGHGQAGGLVSGVMPEGIVPDHLGTAGFQPEAEH